MLRQIMMDLKAVSNSTRAKAFTRFFKTGPGQYGEGDVFIGVTVPEQRVIARKYRNASIANIQSLLRSKVHEHRLTALFILVDQFIKSDEKTKKMLFSFYLKNLRYVNNWDLVDSSAHHIIGAYLLDKERKVLYSLAQSKNLWERRVAVVSTLAFIRKGQFDDIFNLAALLMKDRHDLMHKAVGWMLREIGKKDEQALLRFLDKHHKLMPRTALRYSIERLDLALKKKYMARH